MSHKDQNSHTAEKNPKEKRPIAAHNYPWVGVYGMGYVGTVTSACLANSGFHVIGTDPNEEKLNQIKSGESPIVEPELDNLIAYNVDHNILETNSDVSEIVINTDMSVVCVGTPSDDTGNIDLSYLQNVSKEIGLGLKQRDDYHVVVFRSTIPPGTTRDLLIPTLEKSSGKTCGKDFGVCFHPEFLREGTAVEDFKEPPKTVIGAFDQKSLRPLETIYKNLNLKTTHSTLEVAEMVKYVDNSWHALKVSFSNEIGRISQALKIDSHDVIDIFLSDTKLNISPAYLRPGTAFGGSCLPKDVRGITHLAKSLKVRTPVLNHIIESNDAQIQHTIEMIERSANKDSVIGFLGVTFKPKTDDLRESPVLRIMEALHTKGYQIRFYDQNINQSSSVYHQLEHIKHENIEFQNFMKKLKTFMVENTQLLLNLSDVLLVSHKTAAFRQLIRNRRVDQKVIDLVRLFNKSDPLSCLLHSGVDDYVPKPANLKQLTSSLAKWIPNTPKPRILVAEDETTVARVTKLMLEKFGCKVEVVTNGVDVIKSVKEEDFDLILMDLSMPLKNGLEATEVIRELPGKKSRTPILAYSNYAAPEKSSTYSGICW